MSQSAVARPAIDTHAHVFRVGLPLAPGHRHAPQYDATLDRYLALLDAHGMSHGVLTAPSFYGTDNHHLLDALTAARGRLRGTVIVDATEPAARFEDYAAHGVVGIRLNLYRKADDTVPDFRSAAWRAVFERCVALDWHVEIYGEGPRLARWLPDILPTGVKVCIDHFGSPDPALGTACPGFGCVLEALQTGRVWVKLSAAYRIGGVAAGRTYAAALLAAGGPGRLVWGSDWPWTQNEAGRSYQEGLDGLAVWVPDAAQRALILGPTAAALFGFTH